MTYNFSEAFDGPYQFAWDSTSLGMLKECPRKYQLRMLRTLAPKRMNIHLFFGLLYQQAIEHHKKRVLAGVDYEDALRAVVREALIATWTPEEGPWESSNVNKNRETLIRSIIWRIEHYRTDNAKTHILATGQPAIELSFRLEIGLTLPNGRPYVICGHLDEVIDLGGHLFVSDNKTTKNTLGDDYFNSFKPDNQMTLYTIASQVIFSSPVRGVAIDAAQIMVQGTRFQRGFTYRTPAEITEWQHDTDYWLSIARQLTETYGEADWPMNDKSCFLCEFREVCRSDPSLRERVIERGFTRLPWNPLETRD